MHIQVKVNQYGGKINVSPSTMAWLLAASSFLETAALVEFSNITITSICTEWWKKPGWFELTGQSNNHSLHPWQAGKHLRMQRRNYTSRKVKNNVFSHCVIMLEPQWWDIWFNCMCIALCVKCTPLNNKQTICHCVKVFFSGHHT